ncbi:uncharacterized protein LOC134221720 [Armigeres subalbatus]|uniref:uncharacterized protein LOC134221720 n=1 Tax=Armigeres subalbatus TaxID=124917 RepID=UPI002ED23E9C
MYSPGKYVRAPPASSESDTDDVMEFSDLNGLYVRPRPDRHASCEEEVAGESDEFAHYSCVAPDPELELRERVKELENAIKELSKDRDGHHAILSKHHIGHHKESSPTIPYIAPLTPSEIAAEGTIRWDNITHFPKNVPATKMWEAWTCFIEDFEIASSLSNVRNPKRRVELLLLSMGEELKSDVRAAKLHPDPEEEGCYEIFVKNIDNYLKSMTDPAAEHESFSNMRQEEGESAVNFHARLTRKVQLCGYSPDDQDRFVRTQLLRGLRNQELKKASRMYGHDSNFIVQSATRAEAFQAESASPVVESNAIAAEGTQNRALVATVHSTGALNALQNGRIVIRVVHLDIS